jgi:hypothetical protein
MGRHENDRLNEIGRINASEEIIAFIRTAITAGPIAIKARAEPSVAKR